VVAGAEGPCPLSFDASVYRVPVLARYQTTRAVNQQHPSITTPQSSLDPYIHPHHTHLVHQHANGVYHFILTTSLVPCTAREHGDCDDADAAHRVAFGSAVFVAVVAQS
jgi:hypothetical protein